MKNVFIFYIVYFRKLITSVDISTERKVDTFTESRIHLRKVEYIYGKYKNK